LAATAALAVWATARRASADDNLRIGALLLDNTAEVFYARELGMFKRAGLDVDITTFPSGGAAASALVGGAVDISIGDVLSIAEAHARNIPLAYLAPAILDGRIDAASISEPFITNALDSGKFRTISVSERNVAPEFMFSGWTTTNGYAAAHPDVIKKFVAVLLESARWGNANRPQSAQILVGVNKMPLEVAAKMERSYYGEKLSPALLQPVIDAAAKYGAIANSFPASEIISSYALR